MPRTAKHLSHTARHLLEATSGATGERLFFALARAIHDALGARWAFVGELTSATMVHTRAGWGDGKAMAPVEFNLEGTFSASILRQEASGYPSGVQELFPEDHMLAEMGVEGCFGIPVMGGSGAPIGLIVAMHDEPLEVAEYGGLSELLAMRVSAELEREHAERLLRQNERLQSLSMLAGGVAHDFNNLLTAIMANTSLAAERLANGQRDDIGPLLADVEIATKAAAGLTRQLMAYAGRTPARPQPIDFAALVRETAKMLRPLLPAHVQLEFELEEELPPAQGDMTQLRQVVMNVLRNAGDAHRGRQGSITIGARLMPAHAPCYRNTAHQAEDFAANEPHLAFAVRDTGVGMTAEVQRQIFTPHFTTKAGGHGFGMAITAGILAKHRGAITIDSVHDKGTTMTILLPLASPVRADAHADAGGDTKPFAGSRVLVADDDEQVRFTMVRSLRQLGCQVTEVVDGHAALTELRRSPRAIDCAVLDLCMPGLGGDDIAISLQDEVNPVPIVLSSGLLPNALEGHLRSGTIAAALGKPWSTADLAAALRAALPAQKSAV